MRPIIPKSILSSIIIIYSFISECISQVHVLKSKQIQLFQNLPYDSGVPPIFEDSRGFIWIGSFNGLIKYDGYTYQSFVTNPLDSSTITDNKIDCMAEDSKGNLWVGTQNGLCYLYTRKKYFKRYDHKLHSTIFNPRINQIKINKKDDIIIRTNNGIFSYDKENDEFNPLVLPDLKSTVGTNLVLLSENSIVVTEENKLYSYNYTYSEKKIKLHNKQSISEPNCAFTVSLLYNDTILFLGSTCGLFQYNFTTGKLDNVPLNTDGNDSILSLLRDGNSLLIGLKDQLVSYAIPNKKSTTYSTSFNKGQTSFFYNMSITTNRIMWHLYPYIYSSDLKFNQFSSIRLNGDLLKIEPERINYIFEWTTGKIALTTVQGVKLVDISTAQLSNLELKYKGSQKVIREFTSHVALDSNRSWVSTCSGLLLIDRKLNQIIDTDTQYPEIKVFETDNICIRKLYLDTEKNLWIGTWSNGLYKLTVDGKLIRYRFKTEWENKFRTIFEDSKNQLWFGSRGGLLKYNKEFDTFKIYKNIKGIKNSLSENTSFSLFEDPEHAIWIGTYGGGLNKLHTHTDSFELFTADHGLSENTIFSIYPTKDNKLWLSTYKGLNLFDPATKIVHTYDHTNGLLNNGFNAFLHYRNKYTGHLLFVGNNGVDYFHPDSIRPSIFSPPIYITSLKLFNTEINTSANTSEKQYTLDEDISFKKNLHLTYDQYVISFDYVALDYSAPENIQYAYQLKNFDKDWQYVGKQRSVTFTNLDPGKYTFNVKATNADGVWGAKMASLQLYISPPWWKTWWAYILYALGFVGISMSYIQYRSRSLIRHNKILEDNVRIRTNELNKSLIDLKKMQDQLVEAEKEKAEQEKLILRQKTTELEMQALRAQMNPHFIFNALNSINNFIQQNDKKQASDYLVKFSKLVRSVLEYSRLPLITLYQEIETLKLYIELEALRFPQKLDWVIYSDPELDLVSFKIPPLILQPFVENAIYHGLLPKNYEGKLYIAVREMEDYFQVEIVDNGIGRKKSKLIARTAANHKSFGLDITINRIKLFNETSIWNYESVNIVDLEDDMQQPLGTKVFINLNLLSQ